MLKILRKKTLGYNPEFITEEQPVFEQGYQHEGEENFEENQRVNPEKFLSISFLPKSRNFSKLCTKVHTCFLRIPFK